MDIGQVLYRLFFNQRVKAKRIILRLMLSNGWCNVEAVVYVGVVEGREKEVEA
jgi:hypothetical protein